MTGNIDPLVAEWLPIHWFFHYENWRPFLEFARTREGAGVAARNNILAAGPRKSRGALTTAGRRAHLDPAPEAGERFVRRSPLAGLRGVNARSRVNAELRTGAEPGCAPGPSGGLFHAGQRSRDP